MEVLKQISPTLVPDAPIERPRKIRPSSRATRAWFIPAVNLNKSRSCASSRLGFDCVPFRIDSGRLDHAKKFFLACIRGCRCASVLQGSAAATIPGMAFVTDASCGAVHYCCGFRHHDAARAPVNADICDRYTGL